MAYAQDDRPTHLAFLSPAPWPLTVSALRSAYQAALTKVLTDLAEEIHKSKQGVSVDLAVPISILDKHETAARNQLYEPVQAVVAGVYKLLCVIAAKHNINVEDEDGIDVRIILLAHPLASGHLSSRTSAFGPVISLDTLARSRRPWRWMYAAHDDPKQEALRSRLQTRPIPGGAASVSDFHISAGSSSVRRHSTVAVGGTFDHVHIGHKLLLTMFAFVAEPGHDGRANLACCITGDEMLTKKKYRELLQSWDERHKSCLKFLSAILDFRPPDSAQTPSHELHEPGPNGHAVHYQLGSELLLRVVEMPDAFGPTITEEGVTALVLSAETRAGGKPINDKRKERGWDELEIFEVDVLDPLEEADSASDKQSFEAKLSSTDIRKKLSQRTSKA